MSPATPKNPKPASRQDPMTSRPTKTARSMRTMTLGMLAGVDAIVAILMLVSAASFLVAPDPAVEAGPMYIVLALMTVASVLMALLALNATFLPIMTKAQVANASLVMWTMAATGVVTGILTLGGAVNTLLMRLFVGSLAYAFIWMQSSRIARARAAQSAGGQAAGEPSPPASSARSQPRTRQRRGGRKR